MFIDTSANIVFIWLWGGAALSKVNIFGSYPLCSTASGAEKQGCFPIRKQQPYVHEWRTILHLIPRAASLPCSLFKVILVLFPGLQLLIEHLQSLNPSREVTVSNTGEKLTIVPNDSEYHFLEWLYWWDSKALPSRADGTQFLMWHNYCIPGIKMSVYRKIRRQDLRHNVLMFCE